MKAPKTYTIRKSVYGMSGTRTYDQTGSLMALITAYSYTLECGAAYSYEKGNKKINRQPKSIKSLISNLNKAAANTSGTPTYYSLVTE